MLPYARILVVDDSRATRRIVRRMLEGSGFGNIDEAADGGEALGCLARLTFALVISDWAMNPMSGLDLLVRLRAQPRTAGIPFIMLTAKSQKRFGAIARDNGATHYVEKPFTAPELIERVRSVPVRTMALQAMSL